MRGIAIEQSIFHCWFTAPSVAVGITFTERIREKVIVKSSAERGRQAANRLEIFSAAERLQLAWLATSQQRNVMKNFIVFYAQTEIK